MRVYGNLVIGKPLVLFLLRNSYCIIGTMNYVIGKPSVLCLLRNSYFIIGTALLITSRRHSPKAFVHAHSLLRNIRPQGLRNTYSTPPPSLPPHASLQLECALVACCRGDEWLRNCLPRFRCLR